MDMPVVSECSAESCAYNRNHACHALAITVGIPEQAHCDTYFTAPRQGGVADAMGHVGACKMADCQHNVDLECRAPAISVGARQDVADCLTYSPR
ncbi:DUF1540 domain-containing protein [Goodfellowiella coeruleoviolacea]|uniref:DUF1540 domain-containing protein n=1 Tax=Goodfellowiella coeruleoviolacea TaxID=334858 RepID=A0AAE3KMA5_9PSEU|nr:DUF1540 domain-containing protein [Goodfellowiella coeruleoviolacea]MCP2167363.1 protein of unknown function (DUF1540) [Goodfellowiella coeruleoviolacea]